MTQVSDRVLDKIKKMLALGKDAGATEGEREAAMHHANLLLRKHNLSMMDLPPDQHTEAREEQSSTISADKWARSLASSVASLFFCNYYYCRTASAGKDEHYFIGKQSNVVTAAYMAEYLIKSVKREATKRYKSPTSPEGRSFCVGTVNTIRRRVEEMKRSAAPDAAPGTAVVLANLYKLERDANEQWLANKGVTLHTAKARTDNSIVGDAYYAGREHGKSVSLNQQVSAAAAPKRTLIGK